MWNSSLKFISHKTKRWPSFQIKQQLNFFKAPTISFEGRKSFVAGWPVTSSVFFLSFWNAPHWIAQLLIKLSKNPRFGSSGDLLPSIIPLSSLMTLRRPPPSLSASSVEVAPAARGLLGGTRESFCSTSHLCKGTRTGLLSNIISIWLIKPVVNLGSN